MNGDNREQPVSGASPPEPRGPAPAWGGPPRPDRPYPAPTPPAGGSGIFRQHPLLMLALVFLVFIGIFTLLAVVVSQRFSSGGVSSVPFGKKVAVVEVTGIIMDSREVMEELRRFLDDSSITAVVLRVDSPGGVVGAAQEIYEQVAALAAKKPVVVSMGSVAASGGYYIACPAQKIFANPGTITGSIGVIMEFTNLEELMKWLKVKPEVVKSGRFKDIGSPYHPMTPEEQAFLQAFVDDAHRQFEEAVAKGRKLPMEEVRRLADGRIFTGAQAKELGLVDELGGIWAAIDRAAKLGGIEGEPRVVWPMRRRNIFEGLLNRLAPGFIDRSLSPSPVRAMYLLSPG